MCVVSVPYPLSLRGSGTETRLDADGVQGVGQGSRAKWLVTKIDRET